MSETEYGTIVYAAFAVTLLMIVGPVCVYLATAWRHRRQDLQEIMTDQVLKKYYKQFYPTRDLTKGNLLGMFTRDLDSRFGVITFIAPLALLLLISVIGLWCVARTVLLWIEIAPGARRFSLSDVSVTALLGGFTWVISDHLTRARNRDFTSHDVYSSVFRCLIAIPLGVSVAVFCDDKFKPAIAFLLGAFPTSTLFTILRRLGSDRLKISDDAVHGSPEIEKLPSVGKAFAERLRDEGISSIVELAYSDPIALCIRTNKPFTYVTDCISQSLLWIYIGEQLCKLSLLGLRGAQEANYLLSDLKASDGTVRIQADKTLTAAAATLGIGKDELRTTLEEVAYDPYTLFLVEIWA